MNKLTIFERGGKLWTDSREVAVMIGKDHKNLIRDIRSYVEIMEKTGKLKIEPSSGNLKINPSDFFVESTYISEQNKEVPCFNISKMGCEFVANKLTGEKGVLFTAAYVTQFNAYEDAAKAGTLPNTAKVATPPSVSDASETRAKAMLMNAKNRAAKMLKDLFAGAGIKPEYQIMALQDFYGDDGPRLPAVALQGTKVTFDKGTIAQRLGVYSKSGLPHAQAVGAIIGLLDIAENEREKVPYCNNGHDGFDWQYTESVVEKVRLWLDKQGRSPQIIIHGKKYNVVYHNTLDAGAS